jgi:adenine phosphoribosyltransferase
VSDGARPAGRLDLRAFIRDVPDFPQPGVLFRDITPLLQDATAFRQVIDDFTAYLRPRRIEAIVGIESRGFLFGAPLAYNLGVPFVPVRKAGKLPAERMSIEYALEYGQGQLDIHADGLRPGQRAALVDDLLATGGTAEAAARLIEMLGADVVSLLFLVVLDDLGGMQRLEGREVYALIHY